MNILVLSPVFSVGFASGVSVVIRNICSKLVQKGHSCNVITINPDTKNTLDEVVDGIHVTRVGSPMSKYTYGLSLEFYRYLKENPYLIRNADIIHIHMYHDLLSMEAIYQTKTTGKPIIFSPHYHAVGHTRISNYLHYFYKLITRNMFNNITRIVCCSRFEADLLMRDFHILL